MPFAKGKYAKAISDRSGMEFKYSEMVKEWNGSLVHVSEYESKHPQLDPKHHTADPIALINPRPLHKSGILVSLEPKDWPGQFSVVFYKTTNSKGQTIYVPSQQTPVSPNDVHNSRLVRANVGKVTIVTS